MHRRERAHTLLTLRELDCEQELENCIAAFTNILIRQNLNRAQIRKHAEYAFEQIVSTIGSYERATLQERVLSEEDAAAMEEWVHEPIEQKTREQYAHLFAEQARKIRQEQVYKPQEVREAISQTFFRLEELFAQYLDIPRQDLSEYKALDCIMETMQGLEDLAESAQTRKN